MRTAFVAIFSAAALAAIAAAAGAAPAGAAPASEPTPVATANVTIKDFLFKPNRLTVVVGTEVTWENQDSAPHTATATGSGTFDSGDLPKGHKYSYTFWQPGTYDYVCAYHPFMKAKVIVTAAASAATPGR